jgi:hypothetical protein
MFMSVSTLLGLGGSIGFSGLSAKTKIWSHSVSRLIAESLEIVVMYLVEFIKCESQPSEALKKEVQWIPPVLNPVVAKFLLY